jgi:hypothetical protein
MPKLQIIVGSFRPLRTVDEAARWAVERPRKPDGSDVEVEDEAP